MNVEMRFDELSSKGLLIANRLNSVRTDQTSRKLNLEDTLLDAEKWILFLLSEIYRGRGEYAKEHEVLKEVKARGLM